MRLAGAIKDASDVPVILLPGTVCDECVSAHRQEQGHLTPFYAEHSLSSVTFIVAFQPPPESLKWVGFFQFSS